MDPIVLESPHIRETSLSAALMKFLSHLGSQADAIVIDTALNHVFLHNMGFWEVKGHHISNTGCVSHLLLPFSFAD